MSNIKDHKHIWTEWVDDRPMNIDSQKELIILSVRQCKDPDCDAVQPRIGRLKLNNSPKSKKESK